MTWLYVGFGGFLGSVARFLLGGVIQRWIGTAFPWQTLVINVSGSLLLGFLMRYTLTTTEVSADLRAALTAGFCGGYTTFSTFSYETLKLVEDSEWLRGGLYIVLSVSLSVAGAFLGFILADVVLRLRRGA